MELGLNSYLCFLMCLCAVILLCFHSTGYAHSLLFPVGIQLRCVHLLISPVLYINLFFLHSYATVGSPHVLVLFGISLSLVSVAASSVLYIF